MREHQREAIDLLFQSRTIMESLKGVRRFLDKVPMQEGADKTWELLFAAFASEHANSWTSAQRIGMLEFYMEFEKLYGALVIMDEEMRPLLEGLSEM